MNRPRRYSHTRATLTEAGIRTWVAFARAAMNSRDHAGLSRALEKVVGLGVVGVDGPANPCHTLRDEVRGWLAGRLPAETCDHFDYYAHQVLKACGVDPTQSESPPAKGKGARQKAASQAASSDHDADYRRARHRRTDIYG